MAWTCTLFGTVYGMEGHNMEKYIDHYKGVK